jgi:hypothetical protein
MKPRLILCLLLVLTSLPRASLAADEQRGDAMVSRAPMIRAPTYGKAVTTGFPAADLLFAPPPVTETKATKTSCIHTQDIRSADVRDDRTIRLTLAGKRQMDMKLRGACSGLTFDESFYYQPGPTMQLCERFDSIVARSGSRCQIDAFLPVGPTAKK